MPTAYSYIRFSSEKQSGGDSIRRQQEMATKYIERHPELELVLDTSLDLKDEGLSAYKGVHSSKGALGVFMRMVEDGHIEKGSYLLVESFDRLSRQEPMKALSQLQQIIQEDIVVVTLIDGREYSKEIMNADNGVSLIMSVLQMVRAHEESKTKGVRIKAAWNNKFKRIAEGTQLTKRVPFWINKENKNESIPEQVKKVDLIFKLAEDGFGGQRIATYLNQKGVATPSSKSEKWAISSVKKVLNSRAVIGILVTADGQEHQGYYPKIISDERWVSTRYTESTSKATRSKGDGKETHPLSGLCVCYRCGGRAVRSGKSGRVKLDGTKTIWRTLVCTNSMNKASSCAYRSISYDRILEAVVNCVQTTKYIEPSDEISKREHEIKIRQMDLQIQYEVLEDALRTNRNNQVAKTKLAEVIEGMNTLKQEELNLESIKKPITNKIFTETRNAIEAGEDSNTNMRKLIKRIDIDFEERWVDVLFHNEMHFKRPIDSLEYAQSFLKSIEG